MRLLGREVLDRSARKYPDVRPWIVTWIATVIAADWRDIADVRRTYPSADGVKLKSGNVVTVFNVKGNEYRLLTFVAYALDTVQVLELITHAEYMKQHWKKRH